MSSLMKVSVSSLDKWRKNLKQVGESTLKKQRAAILRGAMAIQRTAIESIQKGPKSGREYQRGARTHVASAPGEAPAADRGGLARGIQVRKGDDYVDTVSRAKYSFALELGTTDGKIKPRPFLFPAFRKVLPQVRQWLREAKGGLT